MTSIRGPLENLGPVKVLFPHNNAFQKQQTLEKRIILKLYIIMLLLNITTTKYLHKNIIHYLKKKFTKIVTDISGFRTNSLKNVM